MSRLRTDGKKLFINAGTLFIFLAGLLIALYPSISSRWNSIRSARLSSDYTQKMTSGENLEEYKQMIAEAQKYNTTLFVPSVPDAFSIRDGIEDKEYENLLNLNGDGMMGYVEIPVIKVELPVFHYTKEDVLLKGAGHLLGSALPVGGERSHCVISAHRGLPNAEMFSNLNLMEEGDRFYFHILNETFAYEVDQILEVMPTEVDSLSTVEGKDYATLVTCTPYGVNTHRLLVRGHRVPYSAELHSEDQSSAQRKDPFRILFQILSVLAGLAISAVFISIQTVMSKKRRTSVEDTLLKDTPENEDNRSGTVEQDQDINSIQEHDEKQR